jgi:hypothetical protein
VVRGGRERGARVRLLILDIGMASYVGQSALADAGEEVAEVVLEFDFDLDGVVPAHEFDESGHGLELGRETVIGAVLAHADFAEGVVFVGVGGWRVDDGEEVAHGVGLLVGGLGSGFAEEFGDALLHVVLAVEAGGAGLVAGKASGVVGFGDGLAGETGLGEGFVLFVFQSRHVALVRGLVECRRLTAR